MRPYLLITMAYFLLISPANAAVIIDEIMYSPSPEFGGTYNEWVELYNNGSEEVNVSTWTLAETSKNHTLYGSIGPSGFLILARKPENFSQYYAVSAPVLEARFQLSDSGESLLLRDAEGNTVDNAEYIPLENASGKGKSIERNAEGWFESIAPGGTPGAQNSILAPANTPVQNGTEQPENQAENITLPSQQPQPPEQAQNSVQPRIEIIRAPQSMKFGDFAGVQARFYSEGRSFSKMRFVAYVFSPAWIARDLTREENTLRNTPYNSAAAVELSNVPENAVESIVLPLFLKCRADYAEGSYTVRVRGYYLNSGSWSDVSESDAQIPVSGENGLCRTESCENRTVYVNRTITAKEKCIAEPDETTSPSAESEEALVINVTVPETAFIGSNFTAIISLKNRGDATLDLEAYSYLYEHSAVMSQGWSGEKWGNARTANSKKVSLSPDNSAALELMNMPRENITPEKYTFKVRIDDMGNIKNSEERIFLVNVMQKQPDAKNETGDMKLETEDKPGESKITGAVLLESSKPEKISFWRRMVDKIMSLFGR